MFAPRHLTSSVALPLLPARQVVTYTWSSPLEVVCTALEAALTRIEFQTFTVWLDIFCLHQVLAASNKLLCHVQKHCTRLSKRQG